MAICIINVGSTGSGKTTVTKGLLREIPLKKFIFDVNNEYREFGSQAVLMPMKNFLNEAKTKKDTCIVFEEATIFFRHSGTSEETYYLLVQKRHTNNIIIFNFHSLRQVPLYILDFCNYMYLLNTNDNPKNIEEKFGENEKIIQAFRKIHSEKKPYNKIMIKLM